MDSVNDDRAEQAEQADPGVAAHRIAQVAHEVNRAYCQALGDHSQKPWKEAPDWQKDSAVAGVRFHLAYPDAGPEASHNNWSKDKTNAGWKYGPVKDEDAKTHPCLVPFTELPTEQQAKDYLFRAIVHSVKATFLPYL